MHKKQHFISELPRSGSTLLGKMSERNEFTVFMRIPGVDFDPVFTTARFEAFPPD